MTGFIGFSFVCRRSVRPEIRYGPAAVALAPADGPPPSTAAAPPPGSSLDVGGGSRRHRRGLVLEVQELVRLGGEPRCVLDRHADGGSAVLLLRVADVDLAEHEVPVGAQDGD